ncbi:MAG: hypothetical protein ABJE47_04730 [bacterium]
MKAASLLLPLCASLASFSVVQAQRPSCEETATVRPGPTAPLQSVRPADGTTRYGMTVRGPNDSAAKWFGSMTVSQLTTRCGADGVVRRVIVYDYGVKGQVVDTTLSVASTLAPIMERTRKPSGDIVLDFSPGVVRGSMTKAGVTRAINDSLKSAAFNSTDLELVVRSLAFRVGLTTTLKIYDPEFGGYRSDTISVTRLEPGATPGAEGTWVVRSRDSRLESTYRIAERSRRLVANDVHADSTWYHITLAP